MSKSRKKELMPKSTLDQILSNIESTAEYYFNNCGNNPINDEVIKQRLLRFIDSIETDVCLSLRTAYSTTDVYYMCNTFLDHSSDLRYTVWHVRGIDRFNSEFSYFKKEASDLKYEAFSVMYDSSEYAKLLSQVGKTSKKPEGICTLIAAIVGENPGIKTRDVWNKIKTEIVNKPDKALTFTLKHTGSTHVLTYDLKTTSIIDDDAGLKIPSKYKGGFQDHVGDARKYFKHKKSRSKK